MWKAEVDALVTFQAIFNESLQDRMNGLALIYNDDFIIFINDKERCNNDFNYVLIQQ